MPLLQQSINISAFCCLPGPQQETPSVLLQRSVILVTHSHIHLLHLLYVSVFFSYLHLLRPFNDLFSRTAWVSQYQKGETSLDLNEARDDGVLGWQWHQLDCMQTTCTSLLTDKHMNTSSLSFYRPDALPDAQPTVSKH